MNEDDDREKKARALELILDAWDEALADGADPEVVASVAIYAAMADMVDRYGEQAVADFCATLPERVRNGEFTLRANEP
jgi:transcription initiation factor TFIIIB Brf1 subunit/transcription initiation factor TFIIB